MHTHWRQALAEPWQAVPEAVAEISEAVRAKVVTRMRSSPVLGLVFLVRTLDLSKRPPHP